MIKVDRQSETYSHMGNISAQGVQRLLGTPSLDRLQTVIRESVQNSWDARSSRRKPRYQIHLRNLDEEQARYVREIFFSDLVEEDSQSCISRFLKKKKLRVLELADYETDGLGGPTDASVVTEEGAVTDFVDFIRNVGTPRDTMGGGGTYGYGKSSLYNLSLCGTIIVDSATTFKDKPERRLIGCRVAESFTIQKGVHKGKYTGRHWWGNECSGERLEPLRGAAAACCANALGFAERGETDLGTSIMILDPDLDTSEIEALTAIQRSLLWNFWPKMVQYDGKGAAMSFSTMLNGTMVPMPEPAHCPPLDLFETAMRSLKSGDAVSIDCMRPIMHLGLLALSKNVKGTRRPGFDDLGDGMFPESSHHVALMRPAELVVKYLPGNPMPPGTEWGGLFLCSEEPTVEQAFAEAEPPAHDDWIPRHMADRTQKTLVNVALKRIKQEMEQAFAGQADLGSKGKGAQLAGLSDALGSLLGGSLGDSLSVDKPKKDKRNKSTPKTKKITNLDAYGPYSWKDEEVLAWFSFSVESPKNEELTLTGRAKVYIDGELSDESPGGLRPQIRVWADEQKNPLSYEQTLTTSSRQGKLIWVGISIPENMAVTFTPEFVDK